MNTVHDYHWSNVQCRTEFSTTPDDSLLRVEQDMINRPDQARVQLGGDQVLINSMVLLQWIVWNVGLYLIVVWMLEWWMVIDLCTRLQDQLGRGGCGAALGGGTRAVSSLECLLLRENAHDSNSLNVGSWRNSSLGSIEEVEGEKSRIHGDGRSSHDVSEGSNDEPSSE